MISDGGVKPDPPSPGAVAVFVAAFLASKSDDAAIRSATESQEITSTGSGQIAKLEGICSGKDEWKRSVRMSSGGSSAAMGWGFPLQSPTYDNRSETTLLTPRMCWEAKQQSDSRTVEARCRAANRWAAWAGRFFPREADLWSHPMAEVLSPRARMHACSSSWPVGRFRHSSQTFTTIPRNSRRLLIPGCPKITLPRGMRTLQAIPVDRLYPPIPKGQASDQQSRVGCRIVTRLMETPR